MSDKLKALVHYICYRMSDDPARLGLTKLNKILWYSDVWSFKRRGQPITAAKYIKQAWGPVAKPLLPVLDELHRHSVVVQRRERFPSGNHVKFFSVGEPDLSPFTADEIAMVDEIIDIVCYEHTAKSISDLSHDLTWNMHAIGEEMPLYRSHVMQLGQVTDEDIAWAKGQVPQTA